MITIKNSQQSSGNHFIQVNITKKKMTKQLKQPNHQQLATLFNT